MLNDSGSQSIPYLRNFDRNKFILNISSEDNALCFNHMQKFCLGKRTLTIWMMLTNGQSHEMTVLSFGQKTTEPRFVKIAVVCHCIKCRIIKGRNCRCENTLFTQKLGSENALTHLDEMTSTIFDLSPPAAFWSTWYWGFGLLMLSTIYVTNAVSWDEEFRLFSFLFTSWIYKPCWKSHTTSGRKV